MALKLALLASSALGDEGQQLARHTSGLPSNPPRFYRADGKANCPSQDRIFDADDCQAACSTIAFGWMGWWGEASDRPAGCFWDTFGTNNNRCYLNPQANATSTWHHPPGTTWADCARVQMSRRQLQALAGRRA